MSAALVFLIAAGVLFLANGLSAVIYALYLGASILTYAFYAFDKRAAVHGWRRTPESTLHILAIIGGWPGAMVAQQTLRHKTIKQPFRRVFWVTVMLNLSALTWLLITPGGTHVQAVLGEIGTFTESTESTQLVSKQTRQQP